MVADEESTTTKYQPVFDATTKTSSVFSINDQFLTSPTFYPLFTTLITQYKVAFTGNFTKIFRGIHLSERNKDFHRFLPTGENNKIGDYTE